MNNLIQEVLSETWCKLCQIRNILKDKLQNVITLSEYRKSKRLVRSALSYMRNFRISMPIADSPTILPTIIKALDFLETNEEISITSVHIVSTSRKYYSKAGQQNQNSSSELFSKLFLRITKSGMIKISEGIFVSIHYIEKIKKGYI